MDESLKQLIKDFGKQQNQHPFLLVDLSGGKENTHTNVLKSLLQFNDYMFFGSFLTDVLNMHPEWDKDKKTIIGTQHRAVGLKRDKNTNGFIDLYIQYEDKQGETHVVVIENKINGATDTQKQMLRYIATVKDKDIKQQAGFDDWVSTTIEIAQNGDTNKRNEIKTECQNRHFVYLTLDNNSKIPEEESLPSFLYDEKAPLIDYNPISYQDNVLPWLKETVLRDFPYSDDGIALAGLRQYIASLERLLSKNETVTKKEDDYVREYFSNNKSWDSYVSFYKSIDDLEDEPNLESDIDKMDICKRLARALRRAAEKQITEGSVPDGWVIHLSPTLMVLYKPAWMNIARGSYSIPFVNFNLRPESFFKNSDISWHLHIEHFSEKEWETWINANKSSRFRPTNHNRTAYLDLGPFPNDYQNAAGRRESILRFIDKHKNIIDIIDAEVDKISSNKMKYSNDKEIRVDLFKQLIAKL